MDLSVTTQRAGRRHRRHVAGEIDVYTAPLLRDVLDKQVGGGHAPTSWSTSRRSTFMDSTGLGVLVGRLKLVRNHGGHAAHRRAQERILKVFRITGLDKVFHIHRLASTSAAAA